MRCPFCVTIKFGESGETVTMFCAKIDNAKMKGRRVRVASIVVVSREAPAELTAAEE